MRHPPKRPRRTRILRQRDSAKLVFVLWIGLGVWAAAAGAADKPALTGDWRGRIGGVADLPIALHAAGADSFIVSPDQSARHIPALITRSQGLIHVAVPSLGAQFELEREQSNDALTGQFRQHGITLPVELAAASRAELDQPPARPQRPKPPFAYRSRDVRFPGGASGVTLAGTLTRPDDDRPAPAVVLIGGSGPTDRNAAVAGHKPFLLLADRLTRAGFAVLRYDKRCVAASRCERSALQANMTGSDLAADAEAAVNWLAEQPHIQDDRIGLIGHSQGSEIAPMVAAGNARIAFLVLLGAPGVPGKIELPEQARLIAARGGASPAEQHEILARQKARAEAALRYPTRKEALRAERALLAAQHIPASRRSALARMYAQPMYRWLMGHDPIPPLEGLSQPVLVIAGGRDLQVPPALNLPPIRRALAGNAKAKIMTIDDMNHILQPAKTGLPSHYASIETTIEPRALRRIVAWSRTHDGGSETAPNSR